MKELTTAAVTRIMSDILAEVDYWGNEDKDAEKNLTYIAGVMDMAKMVNKAIKEAGGR